MAGPIKFTSDVTILPVMCGSVMVATSIGGRVVWICSNSENEKYFCYVGPHSDAVADVEFLEGDI